MKITMNEYFIIKSNQQCLLRRRQLITHLHFVIFRYLSMKMWRIREIKSEVHDRVFENYSFTTKEEHVIDNSFALLCNTDRNQENYDNYNY